MVVCITGSMSGCVTVPPPEEIAATVCPLPQAQTGVYHKVRRGETLWRIAETYGVAVSDIIRSNNIPNVAQIEENQLVFIPGATTVKTVMVDVPETSDDFIWPVTGSIVRQFHKDRGGRPNKGIDIAVPVGSSVKATRSGRVVFADQLTGYGYTVILAHGGEYYSVYAQNAKVLVALGDAVVKNQDIAVVGKQKDIVALHFEIRKNGMAENPLFYLP